MVDQIQKWFKGMKFRKNLKYIWEKKTEKFSKLNLGKNQKIQKLKIWKIRKNSIYPGGVSMSLGYIVSL